MGFPHPDLMLRQLTSPQLTELEAMWALEGGWGDYKQDYRHGQLCSMQANINRDAKKRPQPYTAEDFVMRPTREAPEKKQGAERRIRAGLEMYAGVKAKKKKKR